MLPRPARPYASSLLYHHTQGWEMAGKWKPVLPHACRMAWCAAGIAELIPLALLQAQFDSYDSESDDDVPLASRVR